MKQNFRPIELDKALEIIKSATAIQLNGMVGTAEGPPVGEEAEYCLLTVTIGHHTDSTVETIFRRSDNPHPATDGRVIRMQSTGWFCEDILPLVPLTIE